MYYYKGDRVYCTNRCYEIWGYVAMPSDRITYLHVKAVCARADSRKSWESFALAEPFLCLNLDFWKIESLKRL